MNFYYKTEEVDCPKIYIQEQGDEVAVMASYKPSFINKDDMPMNKQTPDIN